MTDRRPENPAYKDPFEEPKQKTSIWGKIATYAIAAIALVTAIAAAVVTGGAAIALVGLAVVAVGVGLSVYGTEANNEGFATAGMILMAIGGLISGVGFSRGKSGAKSSTNVSSSPRPNNTGGGTSSRRPEVTRTNLSPVERDHNVISPDLAQDSQLVFGQTNTPTQSSNHSTRSPVQSPSIGEGPPRPCIKLRTRRSCSATHSAGEASPHVGKQVVADISE